MTIQPLWRNCLYGAMFSLPIALMPQIARADDLVFTLQNKTSVPLTAFYASPTGVDNWEEDILGDDDVAPAAEVRVRISDGRRTCAYDIKGVFADGDKVEDYKIDLCELKAYEFFER